MRKRSIRIAVLCVLMGAGLFSFAEEPLDQLIQRANAAPVHQQAGLYMEIAERQLQTADRLYGAGQSAAAKAAVAEVVTYSEKATDASAHSASRLKQTEIALRKMAMKLRDIRRSVSFEDQKPVEEAADRLEKMRTDLLARMFNQGGK